MTAALGWGALAASSLVIGALLGTARPWHDRLVGLVLAFGAGALISAVSLDLAQEGARLGDPGVLALGLGLGATAYFALNRMLARPRRRGNEGAADDDGGTELALGAFLDGVPEQLVLGIGVATGEGVSVSLLVAIFVQPPGGDRLVRRDARRSTAPPLPDPARGREDRCSCVAPARSSSPSTARRPPRTRSARAARCWPAARRWRPSSGSRASASSWSRCPPPGSARRRRASASTPPSRSIASCSRRPRASRSGVPRSREVGLAARELGQEIGERLRGQRLAQRGDHGADVLERLVVGDALTLGDASDELVEPLHRASARSRYAGFSLDRAREVMVRAREGRLVERLARAVAAQAGEHGATALAGGQGDLEGVVLAG